jgi:hypothetical protein
LFGNGPCPVRLGLLLTRLVLFFPPIRAYDTAFLGHVEATQRVYYADSQSITRREVHTHTHTADRKLVILDLRLEEVHQLLEHSGTLRKRIRRPQRVSA